MPGYVPAAATFSGMCGNAGTVDGTITTAYDGCADGSMTVTYSGTDACGNAISEVCTVTVTGAGPATIACPDVTIT